MPITEIYCPIKYRKEWQRICFMTRVLTNRVELYIATLTNHDRALIGPPPKMSWFKTHFWWWAYQRSIGVSQTQLDSQTRVIKQILCHSILYFIRHWIFIIGICFVSFGNLKSDKVLVYVLYLVRALISSSRRS